MNIYFFATTEPGYDENIDRAVGARIRRAHKTAIKNTAKIMRRELSKFIRGREGSSLINVSLRKLSEEYMETKEADRPLRFSGFYVRNLVAKKDRIGVRRIHVPGSTLTLGQLARFLEYGTRRMEPIPHWRAVLNASKIVLKEQMKEALKNAVQRYQEFPGEEV